MIELLPVWKQSSVIGGHLFIVFLLRQVLIRSLIQTKPVQIQSARLCFLDYALFIISGMGVGVFNTLVLDVPFSSGWKIMVGFATIGLLPALDLSLEWEYRIIRQAADIGKKENTVHTGQAYSPQTRTFALLACSAIVFLTFVLLLILSRDIFWLMKQSPDTETLAILLRSIAWEVIIVMGTFLGLTMVVVFSYARNLKLLFANQTSVLELVSQGHLETKVPVVTNDEFAIIAGHTNVMIDHLVERERMSRGLGIASQIQAKFLPRSSPLLSGVQVYGSSLFCDETGGDFYDFLVREGEDGPELVIMVGDVTGHGVGAALLMASVRGYMKAHLQHIAHLAEAMNATNSMICRDVAGSGNFVTMFLFSYNPRTRQARWVGAGHDPAIFHAFGQSEARDLQGKDIPLGVNAGWRYNLYADRLEPGVLLLGTDGVWETMDAAHVMFGKGRLSELLKEYLSFSPQEITSRILENVGEFTGSTQVADDRTVVIARLA